MGHVWSRIALLAVVGLTESWCVASKPKYVGGLNTQLPRVKARLEQIRDARKTHPERFAAVEKYMAPIPTRLEGRPITPKLRRHGLMARPLGTEFEDPEAVAFRERNREMYSNIKGAMEEYRDKKISGPKLTERLQAIRTESRLSDDEFSKLAYWADGGPLPLNRDFLLAWEEAMIIDQSNASWIVRSNKLWKTYDDIRHQASLAGTTYYFHDPASLPTIGEMLRYHARRNQASIYPLLEWEQEPSTAVLLEIGDTLALSPQESQETMIQEFGKWIERGNSPSGGQIAAKWRKLLTEHDGQPQSWIDHAPAMLAALEEGVRLAEAEEHRKAENRRQIEEERERRKREQEKK